MTAAELTQAIADLTAARELIATPERWTNKAMMYFGELSTPRYSLFGSVVCVPRRSHIGAVLLIDEIVPTDFRFEDSHEEAIDILTWAIVAGPDLVEVEG